MGSINGLLDVGLSCSSSAFLMYYFSIGFISLHGCKYTNLSRTLLLGHGAQNHSTIYTHTHTCLSTDGQYHQEPPGERFITRHRFRKVPFKYRRDINLPRLPRDGPAKYQSSKAHCYPMGCMSIHGTTTTEMILTWVQASTAAWTSEDTPGQWPETCLLVLSLDPFLLQPVFRLPSHPLFLHP